jgi:uncharacterized protein (DUF305 family)
VTVIDTSLAVVGTAETPASSDGERRINPWPIALAAALIFLGGAFGYLIGVRGSEAPSSSVDVGFLNDMSDHHDQAVTMALLALERSEDQVVLGFAQDVLVFQRSELGAMSVYLADQGATRASFDPERTAMEWMGMPTTLSSMPGMATDEDLALLQAAEGEAFDLLFLELMGAHHEGGIHMSEFAAANAEDPRVRALAGRMAENQTIEVREYESYADRLRAAGTSAGA